jgi:hypothetical protein
VRGALFRDILGAIAALRPSPPADVEEDRRGG